MYDETVLLMVCLSVIGMVVSLIQGRVFVAKAKESMRIARSDVSQTMRWMLASSVWSGFFMALTFVLIMKGNQTVHLSAWGVAAMLFVVTLVCTLLIVGGFLLEVLQLRAFILPRMRERNRTNSSKESKDPNSL